MLQESRGKVIEKNSSMCTDFKISFPGPTIRLEFFNKKTIIRNSAVFQFIKLVSLR